MTASGTSPTRGRRRGPASPDATAAAGSLPRGQTRTPERNRPGQDPYSRSRVVASDAFFVTDEKQRVRAWSDAAERLLGYSAAEAEGRLCYEVLMGRHPEGHPVCGSACPVTRNARRGRGTAAYELVAQARDGSSRYLSSSVVVLEEKRGRFRVVHLVRESSEARPSRAANASSASDGERPPAEQLTRRELEVLRLIACGASLAEIASTLSISMLTARNHATNIEHKLGVRNRLQMVLEGMRRGLV